ncbi:MAG: DUF3794 domain-containing protein [Clostridiales bacterium]|nr:DUF3794 domain-containing protein [Clostridiales bacterium]MCF8021552.1 DUF3794 domain-containing protein [Clostridiales bacterium]
MPNNAVPTTERINVKQVINEDSRQEIVRGTIFVEEGKPDAEQVVSVYKSVNVKNISVLSGKVIVEGSLSLQIVYVSTAADQPVHHTSGDLPFTSYVELPGVEPGMNVNVDVDIEDIQVKRDTATTFKVNAVLKVHAKVTETREIDVLTEIPGCKVESESIKVNHVVGSESVQTIIDDTFNIPEEKPNAEKILDVVDSDVVITETRILDGKVIVDGELTLQILYVSAEDPAQPVHHVHADFTFSSYVEIPGATSDNNVEVEATIESTDVEFAGDEADGFNRLKGYVVLKLDVDVTETRVIEIITNVLDCPFESTELRVESVVGEDSRQAVVRETFTPPGEKPPAEKILDTTIGEKEITEKKILNNKVVINGYIEVHVIYVAETAEGDQPVHSVHRRLSFHSYLDILGVDADMDVQVRSMVEYVKSSIVNSDIHIDAVLKLTGKAIMALCKEVVTGVNVVVVPPDEKPGVCPPGETVEYTIKSGDTFYKIARQYSTTVDAIKRANPGVNPNNLQVGQTIKVPCGAKG